MSPHFEIKSIRPWVRGRKNGGRGRSSSPGEPTGATADLSAVLEAYDRRFESAAARERTELESQESFRVEASRLLEEVILPTVHSLGERVREHGHRWEVESRIDILGQPAVACTFSPRNDSEDAVASELGFRAAYPDRLMVSGAAREGDSLADLPPRSYEIGGVDTAVVTAEITRFVRRVLG